MKAVYLEKHGGPEVLKYGDLPDPVANTSEVLIKVKAVALNHLDIWIRMGMPHLKHQYPLILGSDIVGEIVGSGVKVLVHPAKSCGACASCSSGWDNLCSKYQIFGEHINGGYCELISVPKACVLPYPENLSWEEAAATPLVFLTAWQMLVTRAQIKPGQVVVIHGAGSGVGSAGIQIAKLFGATVITTAGSDEKLQRAKALGADYGINYKKENFLAETTKIAGKYGVDIVFEHIGQAMWEDSLACLKWGGVLVTCGATTGSKVALELKHVFFRQLQILGSTMGSRASQYEIIKLLQQGKLKPVLDTVIPLSDARAAHERLEHSEQFGKIVLKL